MRPFIFISTNLHGSAAMHRAALWSLAGVLVMGTGGLAASVLFVIAVFRILIGGFASGGGRALLIAVAAGVLTQLLGTLLLRIGARMLRRAAGNAEPSSGPRRGVTIEGEFVEREAAARPRLDSGPADRDRR